mmetsp:Transcript_51260/g.146431  ORF Transcript_51260/g.146431 Transcript_51260/m.146431 type:complete len:284 (-) Transcript_51260:563-1414(-)
MARAARLQGTVGARVEAAVVLLRQAADQPQELREPGDGAAVRVDLGHDLRQPKQLLLADVDHLAEKPGDLLHLQLAGPVDVSGEDLAEAIGIFLREVALLQDLLLQLDVGLIAPVVAHPDELEELVEVEGAVGISFAVILPGVLHHLEDIFLTLAGLGGVWEVIRDEVSELRALYRTVPILVELVEGGPQLGDLESAIPRALAHRVDGHLIPLAEELLEAAPARVPPGGLLPLLLRRGVAGAAAGAVVLREQWKLPNGKRLSLDRGQGLAAVLRDLDRRSGAR